MSELFREGLRRLEQEEETNKSKGLRELATTVRLIQQEAKRNGLDKMTMREIDAEIAAARKDMRAKKPISHPTK